MEQASEGLVSSSSSSSSSLEPASIGAFQALLAQQEISPEKGKDDDEEGLIIQSPDVEVPPPSEVAFPQMMKTASGVSLPRLKAFPGGDKVEVEEDDDKTVSKNYDFPAIPPRGLTEIFKLPEDPEEEAQWFRVLTPREIKGIDGPYSEKELKDMYKMGGLKDSTLLWREGERDWTQLLFHKELRPRLLQLPLIPPRLGKSDPFEDMPEEDGDYTHDDKKDAAAYNPIVQLPSGNEIENLQPLYTIPMNNLCSRCGATAVGNLAGHGRNAVDMTMLRRLKDYPINLMSEIIPGFMYIGNTAAAKLGVLLENNISLIINCTNNLANPPDRVPYYRGKVVALKDKPKSDRPANMQAMLDLLDRAADWCENERLTPERAVLSDPLPAPLKLKRTTDKYGRYIRTAEEIGMKRRAGMDGNKKPPPKVLLWSRKGLDRPCFVAGAYMIKFMGMDVERVLNILETARPGASISRAYRAALDEFSKKYALGELLCTDCISNARQEHEMRKKAANEEEESPEDAQKGEGEHKDGGGGGIFSSGQKRAKAFPCYAKFAQYMHARKAGEGYDPLQGLGDSSQYLVKVMNTRVQESGWAGLLDLQLVSRRLGNDHVWEIFTALGNTQCIPHLRVVNIKGNDLTCDGAIQILDLLTPCAELMALNLSCNKIGLEGASRVASFLLTNATVTSLDCSSNPLGDEGVAAIFQCITMPRAEFDGAESGSGPTTYNRTLTALDMGFTEFGHEAAAALINVFRDNDTLVSLNLDFNVEFTAKEMKHVFNSLRSYNKALQRLSLANTPVSTKSIGYLGRTFENHDMPLMRLDLSFCTLASTHLAYLSKSMLLSRHLTHLNINSNDLGDLGGEHLAIGIRGKIDDRTGERCPPLQYVDASFCCIEEEGCRSVIEAICSRPSITSFNLSYNNIGEDIEETGVVATLRDCPCTEIKLNGCNLRSKGASSLLQMITDTTPGTLGSRLRALYIADNQIHDRTAEIINKLLNFNMVIESLDLGFNLFTEACAEQMQRAKEVTSSDRREKKLLSLTVNMLGNACDPYMLETPGMARAKSTFRFGVKPSTEDELNGGLTHIPLSTRPLHLLRVESNNKAQIKSGLYALPMNQIVL